MISSEIPLAERVRPTILADFVGQQHLVGPGQVLRQVLEIGQLHSMIFWGPPGVGKTTLAHLIAQQLHSPFFTLSAINSGVKEIREVIQQAQQKGKAVLFIDEIHRFSKSQQDSLLNAVEKGIITLIGATTENPSFEVITPLLSRCRVYILEALQKAELIQLLTHAIQKDEILKNKTITLKETEALLHLSGGDARKLLNLLELIVNSSGQDNMEITNQTVLHFAHQKIALYDKSGEQHYDIVSAFIKSIRGSDPNAAVYWLARMVEGGEDPKFIARKMLIIAAEDIGNANPTALVLANSCFQAIDVIGYPECELILSQTVIYLASSPKSNASYMAIKKAKETVKDNGDLPVPLHLRNAPTRLMKEIGYGEGYQYSHDFGKNFVLQEYLPEKLTYTKFYDPGENPREEEIRKFLKSLWKDRYKY